MMPVDQASWSIMLRRIMKFARTRDQAEDLLQAALLRLEEYKTRATVQNPEGFVLRAARNIAIDDHRRAQVRNESATAVTDMPNLPDDRPLQCEQLAAYQRLRLVKEGIATLSPRTREAFLLHRLDGLKYREVASRLGISVSAVEKHIARAVLHLSNCLEEP
ncbi:MAG: RNA polymerase sigma factor [Sphingomonadales bacterium]